MKKQVVNIANKEATVISDNQTVETQVCDWSSGGAYVIANRDIIKNQKLMI